MCTVRLAESFYNLSYPLYQQAPSFGDVKPSSDKSISVTWTAPTDVNGVNWYIATAESGGQSQSCEVASGTLTCEIQQLDPYTEYTVKLEACDQNANGQNPICSLPITWNKNLIKTPQSGEFPQSSLPMIQNLVFTLIDIAMHNFCPSPPIK